MGTGGAISSSARGRSAPVEDATPAPSHADSTETAARCRGVWRGGGTMTPGDRSGTPARRRVVAFRVLAALTALLFLAAGLENALAGWMVISGASGDLHPEANRWFIATAGAADIIVAGSMLTLSWR